ncbi:MAG: hypothetical protein CM15mP74_02670 [Halieaceae bacterium]|nr:MAG: hypothetical protein CM15mP74_02670 [Halieaceae bacterium]
MFPDAPLKIFLTASAEARAERRLLQLQGMGESVSLARLLADIEERDARDRNRAALHWLQPRTRLSLTARPSPLVP